MPPTRFSPPRSPSSTRSPTCARQVGADVQDVARGIGLDGRIGAKFLHAGPGYGGSCFPKDTLALVQDRRRTTAPRCASSRRWSRSTTQRKTRDGPQGRSPPAAASCAARRIAVLGLTFKPDTDDMREAPSISIITGAAGRRRRRSRAFDPNGMRQAKPLLTGRRLTPTTLQCADRRRRARHRHRMGRSSARSTSTASRRVMRAPVIVDLRNIYRPTTWRRSA